MIPSAHRNVMYHLTRRSIAELAASTPLPSGSRRDSLAPCLPARPAWESFMLYLPLALASLSGLEVLFAPPLSADLVTYPHTRIL